MGYPLVLELGGQIDKLAGKKQEIRRHSQMRKLQQGLAC
jgi:hypothetical protein